MPSMPWRGKKAAKPATRHKRIDYDERDFEILAPQVSCFLFFNLNSNLVEMKVLFLSLETGKNGVGEEF